MIALKALLPRQKDFVPFLRLKCFHCGDRAIYRLRGEIRCDSCKARQTHLETSNA